MTAIPQPVPRQDAAGGGQVMAVRAALPGPSLHPGDIVRIAPHRGSRRYRYVRVTRAWDTRRHAGRGTRWVSFRGVPLRANDHRVLIGPEAAYWVRASRLASVPRLPAASWHPGPVGRASPVSYN